MHTTIKKRAAGFSMVEVLVAVIILAVVIVGAMKTYQRTIGANERLEKNMAARQTLFRALEHVLRIGRLSGSLLGTCTKGVNSLECFVDFSVPRSGSATRVRFNLTPTGLTYDQYDGTAWTTKITYEGITSFTVCDDTDMATNACPIEPKKLSQVYGAAPTFPKKYFRVQLGATSKSDAHNKTTVQSAFFARNPGFNNLSYEWVSQ